MSSFSLVCRITLIICINSINSLWVPSLMCYIFLDVNIHGRLSLTHTLSLTHMGLMTLKPCDILICCPDSLLLWCHTFQYHSVSIFCVFKLLFRSNKWAFCERIRSDSTRNITRPNNLASLFSSSCLLFTIFSLCIPHHPPIPQLLTQQNSSEARSSDCCCRGAQAFRIVFFFLFFSVLMEGGQMSVVMGEM